MAVHEVKLPNGYVMRFYRDDTDVTVISPGAEHAEPPVPAPIQDDGMTNVLSVVPIRGRLRELLGFFGLDGR